MLWKNGGFTLLELIIVIIVIGILATIALPRYQGVVEKTRVAEAKSMLSVIRSAQIRYFAQYGDYANDITKLDIQVSDEIESGSSGFGGPVTFAVGKYFKYTTFNDIAYIGKPPPFVRAIRKDFERGSYSQYEVIISEDGTIYIPNSEYQYLL
ncbi:MAG: prepilin-type N-terminal cleavage/methylation domain-containing protein [Candidatus Omnitrophica bacterium]|nr:prepilin-type N-terminal cleavage/methylation domain-containing protein [Candidatus Omnitrophota bacterium]MDD5351843.1 prepilin-type N-terminal cleavage/methylation domain-containing protein [Candidatus Omnitrophota bacterium]MDD5550669.1 prepilin-type N-terminal cleavage/methylation domain-containing protein [Candidatus Omnitrophota bacterium]